MKKFKKIIACGLALALAVMQFSALTLTANAIDDVDYSQYTDTEKVNSAIAALRTESHISNGYATDYSTIGALGAGKVFIEATENGVKSEEKGNFYASTAENEGYQNNVFDGDINTAADVNVRPGGKQFYYLNEDKTGYRENCYVDISTNLKYQADIERIFIAFRSETHFLASEYEIYAANSYEDLYNPSNRYFYYENLNGARYQVFDFNEPVNVKYIGIRILKGVTLPYPHGASSSYARLAEIAFFGEYSDPAFVYEPIINKNAIDECVAKLTTDYNLMQSGYSVGSTDAPSTAIITGVDEGVTSDKFGSFYSYNHGTADDGVFDGTLSSHADVNIKNKNGAQLIFVNSDGSAKENTYIDISLCLTYSAKIDKVFVSSRDSQNLMTHDYAVFASNSLEDLYNAENEQYHYVNSLKAQRQVIPMDNTKSVKYVGIRIYEAAETPFLSYLPASAYPRFEEIAVFGKYDLPYFDYTVNANIDDVITAVGNTYKGREKTYSVPLTKDNKIFKEWQINGETAESTVDQYKNTSTLTFAVNSDLEVVAIYEDIPTTLTSETYAIDSVKGLVRIPLNEIFYTASTKFNVYRASFGAINGNVRLSDGDYIEAGTKIRLNNNSDSELTAVIEGDYDANGEVQVSDIVAAIGGILANTHQEEALFAFDANDSGNITVTDVIKARKAILCGVKYNLSKVSPSMLQMRYKTMGRTKLEGSSLYFDYTAAGFSFNAFCYGDVKIDIEGTSWFTVVVDGRESIMYLGGSDVKTETVAENLPAGKHTIAIYKQSEGDTAINVHSVTFNGQPLDAPEESKLLIEFVGDSITCGYGNTAPKGSISVKRPTDGYMSYGTQTARLLGADWSNVSKSGAALVYKEGMGNAHIPTIYQQIGFKKVESYSFKRTADIVVINLGTNDMGVMSGMSGYQMKENFRSAAREFVNYVLEKNGRDTKIVFAFGMMTDPNLFDEVYEEYAAELQEEGVDAFYCRLPTNREGMVDHPTIEGDTAAAEVLSEFIKTNVLG